MNYILYSYFFDIERHGLRSLDKRYHKKMLPPFSLSLYYISILFLFRARFSFSVEEAAKDEIIRRAYINDSLKVLGKAAQVRHARITRAEPLRKPPSSRVSERLEAISLGTLSFPAEWSRGRRFSAERSARSRFARGISSLARSLALLTWTIIDTESTCSHQSAIVTRSDQIAPSSRPGIDARAFTKLFCARTRPRRGGGGNGIRERSLFSERSLRTRDIHRPRCASSSSRLGGSAVTRQCRARVASLIAPTRDVLPSILTFRSEQLHPMPAQRWQRTVLLPCIRVILSRKPTARYVIKSNARTRARARACLMGHETERPL